jgi:hypothetical protein
LDQAEVKTSNSAEENQWHVGKPKRSNRKPWVLDRAMKQKPIRLEPESKQAGGRGTDARHSENRWRKQIGEALGTPAGDINGDRREDLLSDEENRRCDGVLAQQPWMNTKNKHQSRWTGK